MNRCAEYQTRCWNMFAFSGASALSLVAALAVLFMAACQPIQPAAEVVPLRSDATTQVIAIGDAITLDVTSPTGIGGAGVTLTAPVETLAVRLHLPGLEEYRFAYDEITVIASVSSADGIVRQRLLRANGAEEEIEAGSPFWMRVRILDAAGAETTTLPLVDGVFELAAPPDFLASREQAFTLSWIDFYR